MVAIRTYARVLPYEAEVWQEGFSWRGEPQGLRAALSVCGASEILTAATSRAQARRAFQGIAAVRALPLALRRLPAAAAVLGIRELRRSAPPHCEGDLLARAAAGARRAVLMLVGPETVGWGLRDGRLQDAFRSLDEEAIGGKTTGAVPARRALQAMLEGGEEFAHRLFTGSGLAAPAPIDAYRHRLRQAVGRLAAAMGGPPDGIWLGGDEPLCREAERALEDLAPVCLTDVRWGIAAWASIKEKGYDGLP